MTVEKIDTNGGVKGGKCVVVIDGYHENNDMTEHTTFKEVAEKLESKGLYRRAVTLHFMADLKEERDIYVNAIKRCSGYLMCSP